jgi:hypothetical protein
LETPLTAEDDPKLNRTLFRDFTAWEESLDVEAGVSASIINLASVLPGSGIDYIFLAKLNPLCKKR